jgi:hypothetical protein
MRSGDRRARAISARRHCSWQPARTDGRTALDAATALKYETVVTFLVEKGAKPGANRK